MNVFIALKGTNFLFLFAFIAAGVVKCGVSPYVNHSVVYILFLILWDQRELSEKSEINDWFKTHILDRFLIIWTPFWFISVFESTAHLKFTKLQ